MGAVMLFLGWSFLDHPLEGTLTLATVLADPVHGRRHCADHSVVPDARNAVFLAHADLGHLVDRSGGIIWRYAASKNRLVLLSLLGILLGIEMLFNGFGLVFMAFFVKNAPKDDNAPTTEAKEA